MEKFVQKKLFGKLLNYEVEENVININFEGKKAFVKIINSYIINFFVPLYREERNSKAIENLKDSHCDFLVENIEGGIQISTEKLIVKIYDEFRVDIYDKDGKILCEDYRGEKDPFVRRTADFKLAEAEGHDLKEGFEEKIYVSKKMEEEMYFYGLG